MKQIGSDDRIGDSRFVFQTDKHKTFGRSRALACDNAASDAKTLAAGKVAKFAGAANTHGIEPLAAVSHGMRADGESGAAEIGNQTLFMVHALERRRRIGLGQFFQQRPRAANRTFHLPESVAAVKQVSSTWYRVPSKPFVIPTPERMRGAEESWYSTLATRDRI